MQWICQLVAIRIGTFSRPSVACEAVKVQEVDRQDLPGSTTDLGQGEQDTPHLTLVAKTILADELQFAVPVYPLS
jgi:hypothetical protein